MNKEEILNVGVLCGGRSSQQTYNNFVKMYSYAKENGFKGINITFIDLELDKLQQENKQLKSVLSEVREYILEKCPHSAVFRNEHIDEIYEILNKVGASNE